MDFYPTAYRVLKRENARLLRELNKSKVDLKEALNRLEALQQKLNSKSRVIIQDEASARRGEKADGPLPPSREEFKYDYSAIVGESPKIREVLRYLDHVIESNVPVLIQGASGTGKELVARAIHFNSPRKLKKFVAENCAAIPKPLLESELFGYVEGAFTGATRPKKGLFELADGGSLFLDEISNMSPEMQMKLLRVLQDGVIRKVGAASTINVDVRIISASNKNLTEMVEKGRFRKDLFYRINAITVELPPLYERREDIPLLADYFFQHICKETGSALKQIDPGVLDLLMEHDWPGNVRELENECYRMIALCSGDRVTSDLVSSHIQAAKPAAKPVAPKFGRLDENTLRKAVANVEREIIAKALEKTQGNRTKAAKILGLSTAGLIKKMDRCGLSVIVKVGVAANKKDKGKKR
jgi:transcriptional regulator with PAS, ATPase and Fis domain